MKIHIKNGRLIDAASGIDAKQDVFIAAGKIVGIGAPPNGYNANRTIDASGLVVCPGLVDLAVRLREPGFEYMATLESEMDAAVAGGVDAVGVHEVGIVLFHGTTRTCVVLFVAHGSIPIAVSLTLLSKNATGAGVGLAYKSV